MLEDWNPQVRKAAANALGETGNGKVCVNNIIAPHTMHIFLIQLTINLLEHTATPLFISKVLHDELQRRLSEGNEVKRMDALRKVCIVCRYQQIKQSPYLAHQIYTLKLMTPKLLPVFLSCLTDEYISIKIEAISVSYSYLCVNICMYSTDSRWPKTTRW